MKDNSDQMGYEIAESRRFSESLAINRVDIRRWDEMRLALDWALSRDPTNPQFWDKIKGKVGIVELNGPPRLAVFFEVNEAERLVTYAGIERSP